MQLSQFQNHRAENGPTLGKDELEKIKSTYAHLLENHVEKLMIVRVPTNKDDVGYYVSLETHRITFRKKTDFSLMDISLDLRTGEFKSSLNFNKKFDFFFDIVLHALQDVTAKKASLYAVKKRE
jgi:hypothetical protein